MKVRLSLWTTTLAIIAISQTTLTAQFQCGEDDRVPGTGQKCLKTIQTAVPFLLIAPDARGAALGDAGVSLSPTAASAEWNASALAFSDKKFELQATYTPWLAALNLDDVYLLNLQGYGKLDELQTFYGSLRYFSLGDIDFTDANGMPLLTGSPYEMAVSLGYTRQLSDHWSGSLGGQFVLSSLASGLQIDGGTLAKNGTAGSASIGATYLNELSIGRGADLQLGAAIRNLGSKITYTNSINKDFLPANLALGGSLRTYLDDYNSVTFVLEFNKLLVPSPQNPDTTLPAGTQPDYLKQNPIEAAINSFGDASGGFGEEIREINFTTGIEYWYADQFAARVGYFREPFTKGGRQYFTLGVGLKYNVLGLDFSYLVPTSGLNNNPLQNTLRLSLTYTFQSSAALEPN